MYIKYTYIFIYIYIYILHIRHKQCINAFTYVYIQFECVYRLSIANLHSHLFCLKNANI